MQSRKNSEAVMKVKPLPVLSTAVLALSAGGQAISEPANPQYVQIAELEIDPAQLEAYKAAVREHAETAVRAEPGVIALYSVSENENPTHVRVFEIYRDIEAYKEHIEAPTSKNTKRPSSTWSNLSSSFE
jgi:quinol monooxygenase YgiN